MDPYIYVPVNSSSGPGCELYIYKLNFFRQIYYHIHQNAFLLEINATKSKKKWELQNGKKGCNTRTSHEVTHPSTTLAQARLTVEF